jgi:hypothetical protein
MKISLITFVDKKHICTPNTPLSLIFGNEKDCTSLILFPNRDINIKSAIFLSAFRPSVLSVRESHSGSLYSTEIK